MNFDIKDVKSWANRHDVKVGDEGYFSQSLVALKDSFECNCINKISHIGDDDVYCFSCIKYSGACNYGFFLPLDKVKEDKPKEKKYRPFKTMGELTMLILGKDHNGRNLQVGDELYIRYKSKPNITKRMLITNIERDEPSKEVFFLNGFTPENMLKKFEFYNEDDWLPFGVEVEDE